MQPFGWELPYAWPRKPVLATNVVCTSQPLAAQAGLRMLADGGSAVDAAIATAIALTVVEPVSNGIGSDAFAIVWDGRELHGLNASGRSPAAWTPEYFGGNGVPPLGWNSVTVPGAVSAWVELHAKFGKLAVRAALRAGNLATPATAFCFRRRSQSNGRRRCHCSSRSPASPRPSCPAAEPHTPANWSRLPDHAATLETIAATNGETFYRGELAAKLEAHSIANGGAMRASDLAAHHADWVGTISGDYRGYTVHEIPPNGQGIVALIALGILEHFDMASLPVDSADSVHLQIEAVKLAFADAQAYVSDIDHMTVSPEDLLDKEYLRERAALIDPDQARPASAGTPRGGTVYLTAADASGVMVSMIQSNYMGFGSGVVVPGTGIALQNRGADFTAQQGHPNQVGPRKRPYHTIIPGFLTKDGDPVMSFGVMGGPMQPQGHVQVVGRIVDHGQNPQAACDGPRFRWAQGLEVCCEKGFPASTLDELQRRGHQLITTDDYNQFGSCQAIWRLDDGYLAVSDPRRDGQAVGI